MDLITRAIEKKLHICGDERLQRQTWELFQEQSKDKKIFIFGGGSGLDYFFRNCCNHINIYYFVSLLPRNVFVHYMQNLYKKCKADKFILHQPCLSTKDNC